MRQGHYENKSLSYGMSHTRRDRVLSLVVGHNLKVLDVGCGAGRLGKLIKDRGNYVVGIEISSRAAAEAQKVLDQVHSFNIENEWPPELAQRDFDIVLLPEILEHVFNPVAVLKSASQALRDGGSLIITTPNFMTWTNRLRFLFGDFKYQDQGMFDFGHIRWFTYRYLEEVLAQTDFELTHERHIIFPGKLTFLLKKWPGIFAFQFIIKAKKCL